MTDTEKLFRDESERLIQEVEEKLPAIIETKQKALIDAIGPGTFPAPQELIDIEKLLFAANGQIDREARGSIGDAKTELRRVAMDLHAEARAVLQNVFLCPADVTDAVHHLMEARNAITQALSNPTILNARNI